MSEEVVEVSVEEKARKMGWVPQEEFRGDPEKWRDADSFVERGENIIPILKDRVRKMEEDISILVKLNQGERKRGYEEAKAKYQQKKEELKRQKFDAVQEGDPDKYMALDREEEKLKEPEPPKDDIPAPGPSVVFKEWNEANPWYGKNRVATAFAESVAPKVRREGMSEEDFLKEVEKEVRKEMPNLFENPKKREPGVSSSGGGRPAQVSSGNTWDDVPAEGKAAFKRQEAAFKAKGLKLDKDTWVRTYFEEA